MRRLKPWLGLFARLVLGGVLVTAGYLKAFNLSQAKMAVRAYEMFPIPVANIFGLALPWLEIGAGLLLLIGISVRYAAAFAGALMFFFILAILNNGLHLNQSRGGWGAYFLGYDIARQYIDNNAENAVLLLQIDHASPTYFVPPSTNKHSMVSDLTNTSLLTLYQQNYSAVYIARRRPLVLNDSSIINIENLTIVDNSPYGWLKKTIGRYYPTPMYLYKYSKHIKTNLIS